MRLIGMKPIVKPTLIMIACLATGCALHQNQRLVTTEFGRIEIAVAGSGAPSIVLISGLGDDMTTWRTHFSTIAQTHRLVAINRPGYGRSAPDRHERTPVRVVDEIRAALSASGEEGPFVLVGHSLGGTYAELFARRFPDATAGVILVDSRHAEFTERCLTAQVGSCEPPALLLSLMPRETRREYQGASVSMSAQMNNAGSFPNIPLVVITGTKKIAGAAFQRLWLQTQEELATLSPRSRHMVCETCGHYVHQDQPNLLYSAIDWIKSMAKTCHRQRIGPPTCD